MTLLIVIVLTATGMEAPAVFKLASEAECIATLPIAQKVAEERAAHGYIAACVRVAGTGI